MSAHRGSVCLSALTACVVLLGPALGVAATSDPVSYTFTTETYDEVYDHYMTPTKYTSDMGIEMSITLDAPLAAGLTNAPVSPKSWSFDDGMFAETGTDMSRFNGFVSTGADGAITGYLLQIFLDAPHSPGVWVRHDASGHAYSTAIGQEVLLAGGGPCPLFGPCSRKPVTEWAQDRATGAGAIAVSFFGAPDRSGGVAGVQAFAASTVPLPLPILLLGGAIAGLGALRRLAA